MYKTRNMLSVNSYFRFFVYFILFFFVVVVCFIFLFTLKKRHTIFSVLKRHQKTSKRQSRMDEPETQPTLGKRQAKQKITTH